MRQLKNWKKICIPFAFQTFPDNDIQLSLVKLKQFSR